MYFFHNNAHDVMAYFLSPDLDRDLRGGPCYGYTPARVKKIKSIEAIVFELHARTDKQTDKQADALPSGNEGR